MREGSRARGKDSAFYTRSVLARRASVDGCGADRDGGLQRSDHYFCHQRQHALPARGRRGGSAASDLDARPNAPPAPHRHAPPRPRSAMPALSRPSLPRPSSQHAPLGCQHMHHPPSLIHPPSVHPLALPTQRIRIPPQNNRARDVARLRAWPRPDAVALHSLSPHPYTKCLNFHGQERSRRPGPQTRTIHCQCHRSARAARGYEVTAHPGTASAFHLLLICAPIAGYLQRRCSNRAAECTYRTPPPSRCL